MEEGTFEGLCAFAYGATYLVPNRNEEDNDNSLRGLKFLRTFLMIRSLNSAERRFKRRLATVSVSYYASRIALREGISVSYRASSLRDSQFSGRRDALGLRFRQLRSRRATTVFCQIQYFPLRCCHGKKKVSFLENGDRRLSQIYISAF